MSAIPFRTIAVFASPMAGLGFMWLLTALYLLKYSTDVLGIAPAAMGTILLLSRVWDAVSDPVAGYLSDRTRTRWGRRRPWLALGAIPLGLLFVALWNPPASLGPAALPFWVGAAMFLYYSASTTVAVPYDALGAELSPYYTDRNRLYGSRRAFMGVGAIFAFSSMALLTGSDEPRRVALYLTVAGAVLVAVLLFGTAVLLRERADFRDRGGRDPRAAFGDVLHNPHARRLLLVFSVIQFGVSCIAVSAAYYADYVLGREAAVSIILAVFFLGSVASIPAWLALGRDRDKRVIVVAGLCAITLGSSLLSVAHGYGLAAVLVATAISGVGSGSLEVFFPSLQADVIDWDELQTGERKEGIYFATWNLFQKSFLALGAGTVGFTLQIVGFEANAVQTETSRSAIIALTSIVPACCFITGLALFQRFRLSRQAHSEIRLALDARRAEAR